jgi:hypothetical protein
MHKINSDHTQGLSLNQNLITRRLRAKGIMLFECNATASKVLLMVAMWEIKSGGGSHCVCHAEHNQHFHFLFAQH